MGPARASGREPKRGRAPEPGHERGEGRREGGGELAAAAALPRSRCPAAPSHCAPAILCMEVSR